MCGNTVSVPGQVFSGETVAPQRAEVRAHVLRPVQAGRGGRWAAHLSLVVHVYAVPGRSVALQGADEVSNLKVYSSVHCEREDRPSAAEAHSFRDTPTFIIFMF